MGFRVPFNNYIKGMGENSSKHAILKEVPVIMHDDVGLVFQKDNYFRGGDIADG